MQNGDAWRQTRRGSVKPTARPYRTLGRTGRAVSAIGFGGSTIGIPDYVDAGDPDSAAFRQEALAAIQAALAEGINYFDTAPAYGDGRSERLYGEALEVHREKVFIATKIAPVKDAGPGYYDEQLGQSLARLKTDHVDLLQVHGAAWTDEAADDLLDSCLPAWLARVRAEGRCRHVGITAENTSGALERLLRSGRFEVLQIAYSLIYQGARHLATGPGQRALSGYRRATLPLRPLSLQGAQPCWISAASSSGASGVDPISCSLSASKGPVA